MPTKELQRNLPAGRVPASVPRAPSITVDEIDGEVAHAPLAHYLWILRRHLWKIAGFVLTCTFVVLIVSERMTPIYESTVTLDIDRRTPRGIIGQEAMQSLYNDTDQFLSTQMKLVQSDSVLRPVVERFGLLDREEEVDSASAIDRAAPIKLRNLTVARPTNTYLLQIGYRSSDRQLAADVSNAIAQSYLEHTFEIRYRAAAGLSRFMEKQLYELRTEMELSSDALAQFERKLNIINPEEKTNILSSRLLELNSEYTRAQSDRVAREAEYRALESASPEAVQTSRNAEHIQQLVDDFNNTRQKFAEISAHFGPNHPEYRMTEAHLVEIERLLNSTRRRIVGQAEIEYIQAKDRERLLAAELRSSKEEFDEINESSFEYQALKREADGDKKLYEELLRKIKEATINSSFNNSTARIADPARPGRKPVFPRTMLNVVLAFLFSGMIAAGIAIVSDTLDDTIRDPEQVRRVLQTEVIGSLPQVRTWRGQLVRVDLGKNGAIQALDPGQNGHRQLSTYEEAIRTLRNSMLLSDFDRRIRTVLVTSASPSEGKSTIAIHLAIAHAQQHQRTLVVDGDLRRPSVHKRFEVPNRAGLSNAIVEGLPWRQALVGIDTVPNLDLLPSGSASPFRAADLLGATLIQVLEEAAAEYDMVIVDAPPLLGFPEPLQMAAAVDGVIVVARAGETNRKAVVNVLNTLRRIRANILGLVLNEVYKEISDSYYYYGHYGKYYKKHSGNGTS